MAKVSESPYSMNEQLKELAKQAGSSWDGKYHWFVSAPVMEKFAELILFECIKIAVFKGDAATGRAIKEHFGVPE